MNGRRVCRLLKVKLLFAWKCSALPAFLLPHLFRQTFWFIQIEFRIHSSTQRELATAKNVNNGQHGDTKNRPSINLTRRTAGRRICQRNGEWIEGRSGGRREALVLFASFFLQQMNAAIYKSVWHLWWIAKEEKQRGEHKKRSNSSNMETGERATLRPCKVSIAICWHCHTQSIAEPRNYFPPHFCLTQRRSLFIAFCIYRRAEEEVSAEIFASN